MFHVVFLPCPPPPPPFFPLFSQVQDTLSFQLINVHPMVLPWELAPVTEDLADVATMLLKECSKDCPSSLTIVLKNVSALAAVRHHQKENERAKETKKELD
jgi:hypothetical protein